MKNLLRAAALAICAIFTVANVSAQVITAERASEIANRFFANGKQKSAAFRSTNATLTQSIDSRAVTGESNEAPTFHILTPASGEGFVIVSGEEIENPIIGYSFDGTIDTNNLPDGFVDYITDIDAQVKALRKYNAENPQKAAAARSAMQKTNYNATAMGDKVYLETASWGQDYPFNAQCFTSYNGSTNALTGCVPTAYAIIMRYHEWPLVGTGTLNNWQKPDYPLEEITDRTYDYSKMPLVYDGNWSTEQINEVAKLMSHLGHAFMVTYGSSETSVNDPQNTSIPNKYFNYNLVSASYQANFTMDSWEEKIKESIDNGCPIPYASYNAATGDTRHMFVLDGYTANDYFHFNFGWKGNGNGWFKLDAIKPSTGDDYSWRDGAEHYAIFNFTPNKTKYTVNASVSPENAGTVSINGSAAASSATGEYLEGATVTLAATENTGYTFQNWIKGGEVVSTAKSFAIKVTEAADYVANFLEISTTEEVSINITSNAGGTVKINGTATNSTSVAKNSSVTVTALPENGYIFSNWTDGTEEITTAEYTFVATGNKELTATFAVAPYYTITAESTAGGTATVNGSSTYSGQQNTTATLQATPNDGYYFTGWTVNGSEVSTKNPLEISIQSDKTYTANFANTEVTITLRQPGAGYTMIDGATATSKTVNAGTTISIQYVNNSDTKKFSYWALANDYSKIISNDNPYTFVAKESITLYAYKDLNETDLNVAVSATATAGGSATVTIDGNAVTQAPLGEEVTLTATPTAGYRFVKWTTGSGTEEQVISTEATCTAIVQAATTYTANFEVIEGGATPTQYTITATANPGTAGSVTGGGTYNEGATVTLTATPNSGYEFVNWTKGGIEVSTNATYSFTANASASYVANFQATVQTTFAVTTTANPAAGGTATFAEGTGQATTSATIASGTEITLYAEANDGYRFDNWTLDGNVVSTDATCNVTVSQAANYVANFEEEAAESEPEYTQSDIRLTSAQLMSVTKPTHIAVKNLSETNNWYFAGTTNVENFGNEAVFVWTPKNEGVAGEYYLKTLDGKYLGAAGDNTAISYTENVNEAAVFTTLKPVAGSTGTSNLNKDSNTGTYVDNDDLLVRFMTKYSGGTGDVTTWINVTNTTSPNHPKYYNGGYGMYTAHFVYAVSVDGEAPELPDVLFPDGTYKIYWQADNRGYLAYHDTARPDEAVLADVTYTGYNDDHYNSSTDPVDLVWYLITADDGKRYLFQAATGKFLGVDTSIQDNGTGNKLSTTEAWPINVEKNTNSTRLGHYIITTVINGTNNLLCSGCGTSSFNGGHSVRWLTVNDDNQKDGGAPLQLIPVNDVTVADNVMNAVLAVINGTDEPEQPTDPLAGKYFRLKVYNDNRYMNVKNHTEHTQKVTAGGVNIAAKVEDSNAQIFFFEQSGNGYMLKDGDGYYIKGLEWSVDASSTTSGSVLLFEETAIEDVYYIKWNNTYKGGERYFKVGADSNGTGDHPYCDEENKANAATWVLEEVVMQKVYFKAEIEGWRDNNPNTHLGTITIGGTAMKLTPAHQTASELTMPVVEGTALAFTRQYRGFEFNGFYIGSTELGTNPTLTAENVAAIDENNPLIAKFTATDDVTLFYDDDEFSYRIPAIAKTGNGMLVAVSDYRHNLDDIGRDNHGTGTKRVDLVMRTSTDNGATWSETKTIAAGDNNMVGSYQRAYGDAAIAAVGQNIVVMAAAGDVVYTAGTTSSPNKMARIYSTDNGATWTIEEMTTKMYSQSTSLIPSGGSAFFGSGKLAVDPNFNGTGNARIYGALLVRIDTDGYNNFGVFSDDLGATWKILGGDNTNPVAKGDEPKVEILPNGQILLSARRGGGRVFRVFTYGDDKANGAGSWGDAAVNGCDNGGSNATNGEIICLDAKRPNGKPTKILLQSQPKGGSGQYDRRDVTIWYKEVSADETYTSATIASDWTMGKQVSTQLSAYSAMCLQANGEIALFFEEAPCYGDDYTKGYSMVYIPLTIEEITNDNFLNPNADVEYVPTEFSIVLTDAQDNEYRETLDYIPGDVAAVESYLTTTYPFITLGTTGAIADNKYTNTVTLPFKVSNANTTVWHNIYWPSNGTSEGEFYPIYMMANADNATNVAKITEKVHYGNSQYNTYNYADKLGWAVYNVNNSFTFKFKNKLTGKFMAVNGVVSSGNASNVIYTDEANATAFTLTKNTGTTYKGDFAITSVYNGTTGYVCSTSAGYADATNYTGNGHHGAWAKIVESPDYWTIYEKLLADINNFGAGDGKYTENDAISNIDIDALASMPLNSLNTKAEEVQNVKDGYTEITLTVPAVNDIVPGSVKILDELVSHKFVPKGNVTIQAIPAAGYRFVNWTRPAAAASAAARTAEARNSDVVSTDNPYTVTVSEALSLVANFEQIVVNTTLTDAEGNTYEVQVSGFTAEITKDAVEEKLREAYPYITLGSTDQEGNVIDFGVLNIDGTAYTYTNMVELPFRVTNTTYIWHNIYWPSNTRDYDYPVYLSASTADDIYVPKVTGSYAYGDHPTYNTKSGNNNISWAIYNVNNGFEFIFKNKVTLKYIKIINVADEDAQNVQYVENAEDATAFTIEMKPEGQTYYTDAKYALAAMFDETKGYLCSTSATGYNYATHYNSNSHQGAWIEFKEAPDYYSIIRDQGIILGIRFGAGDGKCIITDDISVINNDIANNSDNITFNTLKEYGSTMEEAMNNWPAVGLTINPAEGGTTNINGEENVVHKYVPNGYALPLAAVPAEGYHFVNWTGTDYESTDAATTITMSGNKGDVIEFTANFAKNSYTINVSTNGTGGSAMIGTETSTTVEHGDEVTLTAEANDGYRFVNWTLDGNVVSTDATYSFTANASASYVANFEIEESQDGLTTGYYHIVSRVTTSHEYLYNNALRTNNSKEFTLQSDSKITTNNGIWYITVNSNQLGVKNGDGNALVTGAAYCGNATTHYTLNIERTTDVDDVTYYSFVEGINCTNRTQYNFTLEGGNSVQATDNNYVTTWTGHPDAQANQWRLERVDTDGKNIYDVVVECTEQDVYVTYGSEYAFNGGFFITDATITAQQLTAKKGNDAAQGVAVLVEGNTIRVVDAEYVDITVSATPAEGGAVTINGEAESTLQVVKSSSVTVVATPADGYHFVNWTDAGSNAVSTDATYTFTANSATTLTANFEADVVYHTITVSTYYNNNGGTVKVGEENATSVNVAEGESVRMLATVNEGYEFMGWLKDGVIVKNAIGGGLDFEVQGPDYTLYEIKASAEYVAVFSKITDYTNLEDGKAYRIRAVSESYAPRYIYREGTELKWTNDDSNFDDNSIFVVQKNGNSVNLISAIGYHGWKASNQLGNDEQYNPYAAIKVTYGTKDDTRSLYLESGTSSGIYTTLPNNVFAFMNTPSKSSLPIMDADNRTTNFLFEEVDTYAFQVSAADGSNAKLGTVNLPFATTVPAEVTVYGVNDSNEDYVYVAPLELTGNVLPANTPVLIEAAASGKYGFKPAPASANVYETGFAGTLEAEAIPGTTNAYILSYNGAGTTIKMYRLSSTERTINANKAYFIDSMGRASALQFVFGGTTDIEDMEGENGEVEAIYDLQGRKLSEITEPGFYIVNGKKIFVK